MNDNFVDLHTHSTFSPMDGLGSAEQVRDRLIELGQKAMGLTDHGVSTGHPEFFRIFKAAGIKLVPGVEFYHCANMHERGVKSETNQEGQRTARASLPHLTVLALNQTGYQNLLQLHKLSYREGFYYRPRIDTPTLVRHQKGLVVMSGCVGGQIARLINSDKEDLAFQWLRYFQQNIEHFYAEIVPITGLDISTRHCRTIWKMAEELKIPRVVTSDAHFPRPTDFAAEDTMTARAIGTTVDAPDRKLRLPAECYHCTGAEIMARLRTVLPGVSEALLESAIGRSKVIASACTVEPPRASGPLFNVARAIGGSAIISQPSESVLEALLARWANEGIEARRATGELPTDPSSTLWGEYQKRIVYEFDILRHHGFFNYVLVVADIVRWARRENILCIARGSCGGSLLCWLLGITELDPIKYDLPVERFIGFHRKGLPDIDLDVDARYRDRFWKYLTETYGEENCAQIAALSRFRARQALRDVAAAHGLPDEVLAEALDLVPEAAVADEGLKAVGTLKRLFDENEKAQALAKEYPALLIATALEGQVRQSTIHAAGFVVDAQPIHKTVGIMGKPDTLPVAACDMVEAERLGLLKIDLLAVDMLSVLAAVTEGLGKSLDWLRTLPLDDAETYAMLAEGRNAGVFQLQGNAAGRLMRDLQPARYEDVLATTVLARPGPLQSGGAEVYISNRRRDQSCAVTCQGLHPILERILGPTYGVVLYQEQTMLIAREVGGFEWEDVETIRKIVSKIEGAAAMDAHLDHYLAGARERGIPERDALLAWDQCKKAGNYSFNRAHGAAYAKIAVWSAYLKRHHPAAFAAAYACFEEDADLRRRIFNEFRDLGGKFVLIDPNRSRAHFTTIDDHTILGGFQDLEGCGPKNAEKLVACQPYDSWDDFYRVCPKTLRDRLYATGIHEGRVDQDAVLHVAPWYVEVTYSDVERAAAERMSATTVAATGHADRGELRLIGRVTQVEVINVVAEAKKYGQKPPGPGEPTTRAVVTLADETGSTLLHLSPRRLEQLVAQRSPLRGPYEGVGNSVYVCCSWNRTHTRLYVDDMICFKEAPLFVPVTPDELDPVLVKKKATKRRSKKSDGASDGAADGRAVGSDTPDGNSELLADSADVDGVAETPKGGDGDGDGDGEAADLPEAASAAEDERSVYGGGAKASDRETQRNEHLATGSRADNGSAAPGAVDDSSDARISHEAGEREHRSASAVAARDTAEGDPPRDPVAPSPFLDSSPWE